MQPLKIPCCAALSALTQYDIWCCAGSSDPITQPVPAVLLASHLKTLRLPTFLREHDKRARQCAREDVGHVAFALFALLPRASA